MARVTNQNMQTVIGKVSQCLELEGMGHLFEGGAN